MKMRIMIAHAVVAAMLPSAALCNSETIEIRIDAFIEENKPAEVCKLESRNGEAIRTVCGKKSSITLTESQLVTLRAAFAAEAKTFALVGPEKVLESKVMVTLRYMTGQRRLELRHYSYSSGDKTAQLSSEMQQVIKKFLGIDMANPVASVKALKSQ